ncbi:unnamed protein product, partial [Cyprideis torosa]
MSTLFGPVVDGVVVLFKPSDGDHTSDLLARFDVMQGVVRAESFHLFSSREIQYGLQEREMNQMISDFVKNVYSQKSRDVYAAVMVEYTDWSEPSGDLARRRQKAMDILSDARWIAPQVKTAELHSNLRSQSYFYEFLHQTQHGVFPEDFGCIHGQELPYVFGLPVAQSNTGIYGPRNYTDAEKQLSELVMMNWANFIESGDPNVASRPNQRQRGAYRRIYDDIVWPRYDKQNQRHMTW